MNKILLSTIMSVPLWASACGGNGGGTPAPTAPSSSAPPAPTSTTVNIMSSAGANAFNPNPVQVPNGGTIVWRNSTNDVHTLVMSDGGGSIGTVAPGASMTTTLNGNGGNYRCTLHPTMVGSINGSAPPAPGNDDDDGY